MMVQFTQIYSWQQQVALSKLKKLDSVLDIVSFAVQGDYDNIYQISEQAAIEAMKIFSGDIDENIKPEGKPLSVEEFIVFDHDKKKLNVRDWRGAELAYALLMPPYGIRVKIEAELNSAEYFRIQTEEFTKIYKMFVSDMLNLSEPTRNKVSIYRWSDDWSYYFDAGKEWWGCFYWTIYNPENHTIIVIGASTTD